MTFSLRSQAAPSNIGFSSFKDQIHHIKVTIPSTYFELDGELKILFQVRVDTTDINNESGGFDNIKITAKFDCRTPNPIRRPTRNPTLRPTPRGCVPSFEVYQETFEDGSLFGWSNGRLEFATEFTMFLGRYGKSNSGPGKDPFKVYEDIPRNADSVELEFDFYEIDSWEGSNDSVSVLVDEEELMLGTFDQLGNELGRTGGSRGMTFRIRSQSAPRNIGFGSFRDQIHRVTVTIPRTYYARDGELKIMFQVRVDATDVNDESGGFDNIKITAKFNC